MSQPKSQPPNTKGLHMTKSFERAREYYNMSRVESGMEKIGHDQQVYRILDCIVRDNETFGFYSKEEMQKVVQMKDTVKKEIDEYEKQSNKKSDQ